MSTYENDLKDCQAYAQQQSGMVETAAKRVGAVIGGVGGVFSGNQAQDAVVKRCLSGRGYKVLN
jgi:hypothetical protein